MEIRQANSPQETRRFDTRQMRSAYLIESLFINDEIAMTYSHLDRTIVGGAAPVANALTLESNKQIGSPRFLDRREIGIINVGGAGSVSAGGQTHELNYTDGLYLPKNTDSVVFSSADAANPAQFYFISTPAHAVHKAMKITAEDANLIQLGTQSDANVRQLRQYIHPDICASCQLVMGVTLVADGSVWNTMPCHTHDRRSEVYLYFDMAKDTRIVHLMGEPQETRHLIVKDKQAILSPGWSVHSGAGTGRYGFIWSMAGDNQDFTDMDFVDMADLR